MAAAVGSLAAVVAGGITNCTNMKITTSTVTKLVITDAPALDPVHAYLEDIGPGQGSLIVRCFDRAWYAYWGAMGDNKDGSKTTVRQFVMCAGPDYVANCLVRGNRSRITSNTQQSHDEAYVLRIATAVRQAIEHLQPRVTPQRKARIERLAHANALIKAISDYGRRFFWNEKGQRVARLEMDSRGRLWWIDDYKGSRVSVEKIGGYEHAWRGFSHGGTLRSLAQKMRDYIKTGERIHLAYIAQDCWGYSAEATLATKDDAKLLPIIQL